MSRYEHIHGDPAILPGRPATRGARLSAAFPPGPSTRRWTAREIPENYPLVSRQAMRAVFAFAGECVVDFSAHTRGGRSA